MISLFIIAMANLGNEGNPLVIQLGVPGTDGVRSVTPEFYIYTTPHIEEDGTNVAVAGSVVIDFGGSQAWEDAGFNTPSNTSITLL